MDALIYILLFSSSVLIVIETWTIYTELKQKSSVKYKLEIIRIDKDIINKIEPEQFQKNLTILDTIEVSDLEPSIEIENLLQSYKTVQQRLKNQ
jgi:hypothetical protein